MKAILVGTGRMGKRYLSVLKDLSIEVVAIADVKPEAVESAAQEYSISKSCVYYDPAKALALAKNNLVIVATTAPCHAEYTIAAAHNKARYIVCEKPMAVSIDECRAMIAASNEHGSVLAINHQMRYMEQYTIPKKLLLSPEFGGFTSMTVIGGNVGVAMNGSHYVEAFRYISDGEPLSVSAWYSKELIPNPRGPQFLDQAGSLRITAKNGTRCYMEIGADQGYGMRVMYGAKYGQIFVDEGTGSLTASHRKASDRALPLTRVLTDPEFISMQIQPADSVISTKAVIEALLAGRPVCSGEDAMTIIATLVAADASNERGHQEVLVDNNLNVTKKFPWA